MRVYVLEIGDANFVSSDEEFKSEAKNIGQVLSLKEFQHRFNEDANHYIILIAK